MTQELKTVHAAEIAPAAPTPATLLQLAIAQNADIDKLEKLMELQRIWEANEARKAYAAAMADFKAEKLEIDKNRKVSYGNTSYKHATLDNVVNVVGAALSRHGLMHTWRTEQEGGKIRVTCIITHKAGHSESTALEASPDTSGSKNAIQAIGSAVTYLQRYTLIAATGVATGDDDDGVASDAELITEDQAEQIMDLMAEVKANEQAFYKYFDIEGLSQMPASEFLNAMKMLNSKKRTKK